MLHYLLQIVAFQVIFLLVYDLFLKRETFFNYNRVYLLGTAILSFVLPFIKLETMKAVVPEEFVVVLPEVIIGNISQPTDLDTQIALQTGIIVDEPSIPVWQIVFYSGAIFATLLFLFKFMKLYWLKSNNPKRWRGNVLIVKLLKSSAAFSFFNTIFLGEKLSEDEQPTILKHELVHVKQLHSIDLLVFEFMRILLWFNPLVYMYQNRIKALHEYIADDIAVKQSGKKSYYQDLLNQVFETNNLSFTNTFFKSSLIKKRIAMLQKSKSKQIALVKYTLLIPIVFGMLIYTSAEVKAQEPESKTITEVIEVQEISEKELIDKYYKQMKAIEKSDGISKVMNLINFDISKFRMSLDEYARLSALNRVMFIDKIEKKILEKTATKSDKEALKQLKDDYKTYAEYVERTKTEDYGRKWETLNDESTLRLYVKDAKNLDDAEKERMAEKIELINKDSYWDELLISDGNQTQRMTFHKENDEVVSVDNVVNKPIVTDATETVEVPYAIVENIPTFEECKDLPSKDRKKCTSKTIASFVNKNFNTDLATKLGLVGRQRISVFFKINKEGDVSSIAARAPHPRLEEEAKRVIAMLPQFIPGTQKGKPVVVPYSLPILFQVNNTPINPALNPNPEKKVLDYDDVVGSGVAYSVIDKAPVSIECQNLEKAEEKKKCTSQSVAKFVNKNFNMDIASKLGLVGRQRIKVGFKIGTDGKVHSAFARAVHPRLEEEAVRVVNDLPAFIPGEQEGQKVDVLYSLPIMFQVAPKTTKN
ncbi:M56 family metallopeptidase [Winogradskyella jejuensis]|uniref:Signal transducer regulating beta-lactamase production, contains metallopeptidase domain n=1 Tax=Winogradskyella jejuensis TaxID=1089305 RepID=A0A1M5P6Z0_9FLAO|nr:M56 family metallopeptidase [Winogradskyella jejuensis]SHG97574.1 Signal transducer regulating beta-lactamase production, contains metallopeptidase domain [Winogradskyella jejuensis]